MIYDINPSTGMFLYVAFAAYASLTRDYSPQDTVAFDETFFNHGNWYNPIASVFTCPFEGFYFLYGQFYNVFNEAMSFEIRQVGAFSFGNGHTSGPCILMKKGCSCIRFLHAYEIYRKKGL